MGVSFHARGSHLGTARLSGSQTEPSGHRHKDEITQAVNPTVVIGGDVQTFCHGAG